MSTLRVLNGHGDQHVSWSDESLDRGDPEARAAVLEAERIFELERQRGATAFRVRPGSVAERIDALDPHAHEIVVIPPLAGG